MGNARSFNLAFSKGKLDIVSNLDLGPLFRSGQGGPGKGSEKVKPLANPL